MEAIIYSSEISKKWFQSRNYTWQSDNGIYECQCCQKPVTMWTIDPLQKRHHCRSCGKIICSFCSRVPEGVMLITGCPERTCRDCWPELEAILKSAETAIEKNTPNFNIAQIL